MACASSLAISGFANNKEKNLAKKVPKEVILDSNRQAFPQNSRGKAFKVGATWSTCRMLLT